ncbi:hypothetical protein [Vacuolonema iberomarrocanum]|uniref:hypothetical protein n=1 Tax=Vacuolonema iberomarrocanum TaxID=3454632 RepID=UPI001A0EB1AE|nr:hypothetical protein [filamentous cyanobacterium LEGE 07170]
MFYLHDSAAAQQHYEVGWAPLINFCVWALEQDGMQVPPFVHHRDGHRRLQNLGMTAEMWQSWFVRVATMLDTRLQWHVEDVLAEVEAVLGRERRAERLLRRLSESGYPDMIDLNVLEEAGLYIPLNTELIQLSDEELNEYQDMVIQQFTPGTVSDDFMEALERCRSGEMFETVHSGENRSRIEQEVLWKAQQYQSALASFCEVFGDRDLTDLPSIGSITPGTTAVSPAEVWYGDQSVERELNALWDQYRNSPIAQQHLQQIYACTGYIRESYSPLDILFLYPIVYSAEVEYLMPPTLAIITVTSGSADVGTRVLSIIQRLAAAVSEG